MKTENKYKVGTAYTIEDDENIIGFVADKNDAKMIIKALNSNNDENAQKKLDMIMSILGKKKVIQTPDIEDEEIEDGSVDNEVNQILDKDIDSTKTFQKNDESSPKKSKGYINNLKEKVCPNCGKTFLGPDRKRFCCPGCKSDFHHKNRGDRGKPLDQQNWKWMRVCPVCGKKFGTNFQDQVYCSKDCRIKFQQNRDNSLIEKQKITSTSDTITTPEGMKPPRRWCGSDLGV